MVTQNKGDLLDDAELSRRLAATPGLDLGREGRLVRLPPVDRRTETTRRVQFEWVCADGVRYNLVAGAGAAGEYAGTQAFYRAFPALGIRPAALLEVQGVDVAVLDHFEGRSLEELLAEGAVAEDEARRMLDEVIDRLEAGTSTVSAGEALAALEALQAEIKGLEVWGVLDRHYLDEIVFPQLRRTLDPAGLRQRWTTGDFVARNLLVGRQGGCRLKDCEFAVCSPFAAADFLRFGEFSDVPEPLKEHVRRRLPGDPRWWRIHFCLDQACKLARVRAPEAFVYDAGRLIERMVRETQDRVASPSASCLARLRSDCDALQRHTTGLQEHYDALQAQYDAIQTQYDALQAQYDALDRHTAELQQHYDALQQHTGGLQEQWNLLERHAQELQRTHEVLAARAEAMSRERAELIGHIDLLKHPWRRLWRKRSGG